MLKMRPLFSPLLQSCVEDTQFSPHLDERVDRAIQLSARMRCADLGADTGLALGTTGKKNPIA